ncbi:hypothetical protein TSOC_008027 [Tetrabaena socialis]|uniref:Uncharacterized protein n=1 Tax=Tetrabaena socialis TaxID=47790 RepID=A0A2J7ZZJ6_9CHLO|nr:hypothetical protein TSOC_008027 [Tetrabaena socialis]|eukprot:PNH05691.1 hypothetical protein TSOC_008027 [Tetrabaena socialis]
MYIPPPAPPRTQAPRAPLAPATPYSQALRSALFNGAAAAPPPPPSVVGTAPLWKLRLRATFLENALSENFSRPVSEPTAAPGSSEGEATHTAMSSSEQGLVEEARRARRLAVLCTPPPSAAAPPPVGEPAAAVAAASIMPACSGPQPDAVKRASGVSTAAQDGEARPPYQPLAVGLEARSRGVGGVAAGGVGEDEGGEAGRRKCVGGSGGSGGAPYGELAPPYIAEYGGYSGAPRAAAAVAAAAKGSERALARGRGVDADSAWPTAVIEAPWLRSADAACCIGWCSTCIGCCCTCACICASCGAWASSTRPAAGARESTSEYRLPTGAAAVDWKGVKSPGNGG